MSLPTSRHARRRPESGRRETRSHQAPIGLVARLALALTAWSERWIPDAFIFALLATVVVVVSALAATAAPPSQIVDAWGRGFWELIPFTLQHTIAGAYREGSVVNLEADVIARYVARNLRR